MFEEYEGVKAPQGGVSGDRRDIKAIQMARENNSLFGFMFRKQMAVIDLPGCFKL
jgi:hypothetical protein